MVPQEKDQVRNPRSESRGDPASKEDAVWIKPATANANVVERCIGWLKRCRRVGTRYEKLAVHYLGMVKLAMIQRCLRLLEAAK